MMQLSIWNKASSYRLYVFANYLIVLFILIIETESLKLKLVLNF